VANKHVQPLNKTLTDSSG